MWLRNQGYQGRQTRQRWQSEPAVLLWKRDGETRLVSRRHRSAGPCWVAENIVCPVTFWRGGRPPPVLPPPSDWKIGLLRSRTVQHVVKICPVSFSFSDHLGRDLSRRVR